MPLSNDEAKLLREMIDARRRALVSEIRDGMSRVRSDRLEDLAGPAPDPGDESVASLISDLDQADAARDVGELRSLETASDRIAEGTYGVCIDCGADVGFERLRANPAALRCIRCQERHEKTFAGNGRTTL